VQAATAAHLFFLERSVICTLQSSLLQTQCLTENLAILLLIQDVSKLVSDLIWLRFQGKSIPLKFPFLFVSGNLLGALCFSESIRWIDLSTTLFLDHCTVARFASASKGETVAEIV
jgi:hypothetical protein